MPNWVLELGRILLIIWYWLTADATCRAALITVIGASLGVWLNLARNRAQQREAHLLTLRREVYLDFCDKLQQATQALLYLPLPSQSIEKTIATLQGFGGTTGKMNSIADEQTVYALLNLNRFMANIFKDVAPGKLLFEANKRALAELEDIGKDLTRKLQSLNQLYDRSLNVQGSPGSDELKATIQEEIRKTLARQNELIPKEAEIYGENRKLEVELQKAGRGFTEAFADEQSRVVLAIRRELGIVIDEEKYRGEIRRTVSIALELEKAITQKFVGSVAVSDDTQS